jgi:hypothetical protein
VARFLPEGTPDPSFGDDGLAIVDFPEVGSAPGVRSVALDADGRILVLGQGAAGYVMTVARLWP